jgi:hypothetical protein
VRQPYAAFIVSTVVEFPFIGLRAARSWSLGSPYLGGYESPNPHLRPESVSRIPRFNDSTF